MQEHEPGRNEPLVETTRSVEEERKRAEPPLEVDRQSEAVNQHFQRQPGDGAAPSKDLYSLGTPKYVDRPVERLSPIGAFRDAGQEVSQPVENSAEIVVGQKQFANLPPQSPPQLGNPYDYDHRVMAPKELSATPWRGLSSSEIAVDANAYHITAPAPDLKVPFSIGTPTGVSAAEVLSASAAVRASFGKAEEPHGILKIDNVNGVVANPAQNSGREGSPELAARLSVTDGAEYGATIDSRSANNAESQDHATKIDSAMPAVENDAEAGESEETANRPGIMTRHFITGPNTATVRLVRKENFPAVADSHEEDRAKRSKSHDTQEHRSTEPNSESSKYSKTENEAPHDRPEKEQTDNMQSRRDRLMNAIKRDEQRDRDNDGSSRDRDSGGKER